MAAVLVGLAWFCLGGGVLRAQTVVNPWWAAPPPAVWTVPQPAPSPPVVPPMWSVPIPTTTAYFPLPSDAVPYEAATVEPPADGHLLVTIAESFLSTLFAREVTDTGTIRDCLLGADLFGEQLTVTRLSVDCRPCPDHARVLMRLTGAVSDHTVGVTRPAAVETEGSHHFEMTKLVEFDGRQFTTRTPSAWVTPQIAYRGATTIVSGVPVIGSIGTAIALSEAERRRPAAEQYALQRVTRTAAPRFNREVDQKLSKANQRLSTNGLPFLEKLGLSASDQLLKTSEDRLYYTVRVPARVPPGNPNRTNRLGPVFLDAVEGESSDVHQAADPPAQDAAADRTLPSPSPAVAASAEAGAVTILVHEDFVNHLLDRLPLGGREVPDRLIDRFIETLREVLASGSLTGMSFDPGDAGSPEFATILLDPDRPISVRFAEGQAVLTLRAGFRAIVGRELPTQNVEIPFRVTRGEQQVTIDPGAVTVTASSAEDGGPLDAVARPVIRQQVQQRLQPIVLTRTVPVALGELRPTTLSVRDVVLDDGWLAITLD
ncbi:MAG: hypothetical protein AB7I48_24640 [Planctomycetaceae bacterium]